MRDALEFEWLGIPSVAIIADALRGPADAMLALSAVPNYPYVVTEFPVGPLGVEAIAARGQSHATEVLALLTQRDDAALHAPTVSDGGPTDEFAFADDHVAQRAFRDRGFTDGLPVLLPRRDVVDALLATVGDAPDDVVVALSTRDDLTATVYDIAVNAAMAGVDGTHFPVVLAAMRAMAEPAYNLHAHTATMAGAQQLLIVRGPAARRLGFRSEEGALGPGWPANNTVGRAVRLVVRNVLRSVPSEFDRAGFSHPGRFGWCIAEDYRTPWPLGPREQSEVLAYATVWQASVINHDQTANALLDEIVLAARTGCHTNWLHRDVASASSFYADRPFLFITGREHARVLVREGFDDGHRLREMLFEGLTAAHPTLRPVAIASPENIAVLYVHATGMQQSWFFAPFQSHGLARRSLSD